MIDAILTAVGAFFLSLTLTAVVRRLAVTRGVLDIPNARSSHSTPTPRGGGVAVVLAATAASVALASRGVIDRGLFLALAIGGIVVGAVGLLDDRRHLSARVRLTAHFAAALWALLCLGGLPPLLVEHRLMSFGAVGYVVGVLGISWTLNLFNFMDGIDGIAASEAAFVACGGALIAVIIGVSSDVAAMGFSFGVVCCAFLLWNWPPAKIFLGDVGSGYLGYVVAVLALAAARDTPVALWTWLILSGVFFIDATLTLVRRLLRRERIYEAHRNHTYQLLARRWRSHLPVTLSVLVVDVCWLLPCAVFAALHPAHAAATAGVALVPLVVVALAAGAGRSEAS